MLALYDREIDNYRVIAYGTRFELWTEMYKLRHEATLAGKRVLFGFDYSYGFPVDFYKMLTASELSNWDQVPHLIGADWNEMRLVETYCKI